MEPSFRKLLLKSRSHEIMDSHLLGFKRVLFLEILIEEITIP